MKHFRNLPNAHSNLTYPYSRLLSLNLTTLCSYQPYHINEVQSKPQKRSKSNVMMKPPPGQKLGYAKVQNLHKEIKNLYSRLKSTNTSSAFMNLPNAHSNLTYPYQCSPPTYSLLT